jgi:putative ABC transport system permease protein
MDGFGTSFRPLRPRVPREVEEELRFHLEMRIRDLKAAGLSHDEARREARRHFGNLNAIAAECRRYGHQRERKVRRRNLLAEVGQDMRYAMRQFARNRGFAAITVLTVGLGIGAATAMFGAVDAALLRPLPFHRPDRLVVLPSVSIPFDWGEGGGAPDDNGRRFLDITDAHQMTGVFSNVAAYAAAGINLSDPANPVRLRVGVVTTEFFTTLGVAPVEGRTFAPAEGVPGGPPVVVLSYGLWQRQFGGEPMLGKHIRLNDKAYAVVGVMPRGFTFPDDSDVWIPLTVPTTAATFEPFRGWLPSQVVARLADGVSTDAATARVLTRWEQVAGPSVGDERSNLDDLVDRVRATGAVQPLQGRLAQSRRSALLILLGATGLVLLIACANVTSLLLSRGVTRRREMAIRTVLGAGRRRLIRQLLIESAALVTAAAVLGIALAWVFLRVTGSLMPEALAVLAPPRVDVRVLSFAIVMSGLCALGCGLWPALISTREGEGTTIKRGGGWGATRRGTTRARRALVGAELALTLVLIVGAGLMLRSLVHLMETDLGIRTNRVATVALAQVRTDAVRGVLDHLGGAPGIESIGVVNDLPLAGEGGIALRVSAEGRQAASGEPVFSRYLFATGGYFRTLGIPLLHGRVFTRADEVGGAQVAVINARMARELWGSDDPVGRSFFRPSGSDSIICRVIGVVGNVRERPEEEAMPQMYFPPRGTRQSYLSLLARSSLPPGQLLRTLRNAVRAADPSQAVYDARMMDDVLSGSVAPRRVNTFLIAGFGAMALLLAALGVYGIVSHSVTQRAPELGIRAALGATGRHLMGLVAIDMLWICIPAFVLGGAGAWAGSRLLGSLLYGIGTRDAATFFAAPAILLAIVLLATLLPAARALRLQPLDVIRTD